MNGRLDGRRGRRRARWGRRGPLCSCVHRAGPAARSAGAAGAGAALRGGVRPSPCGGCAGARRAAAAGRRSRRVRVRREDLCAPRVRPPAATFGRSGVARRRRSRRAMSMRGRCSVARGRRSRRATSMRGRCSVARGCRRHNATAARRRCGVLGGRRLRAGRGRRVSLWGLATAAAGHDDGRGRRSRRLNEGVCPDVGGAMVCGAVVGRARPCCGLSVYAAGG